MSQPVTAPRCDPTDPGSWSSLPSDVLFSMPKTEVEAAQRDALVYRFETLRPQLAALDHLASRQGVDQIESFADAIPAFFDHRVYKSYPLGLIEQRKFDRMTAWMQRLTTHDISQVPTEGIRSVDSWLDRLAEHGLSVGHSTGTKGKLSFLPRSDAEWPTFSNGYYEFLRALYGFDIRQTELPSFLASYRRQHYWLGARLNSRVGEVEPGARHFLYDHVLTADLLSLAARMQSAEAAGEVLEIDPQLLEQREQLVAWTSTREEGVERWLSQLADHRGQQLRIQGTSADLTRAALRGRELGIVCEPAPNSILVPGGGMKGYKDAPDDWEALLKDFYGVDRTYSFYGMSECLGYAPRCEHGFYHFYPYTLPVVLDENYEALPRSGVQTGRMALFDFLAESYWGGFITGDQVTMHWDYDCECGQGGPRIDGNITRFSDLTGGEDDKISCAGTTEAYNAFMDFVAEI
jgi:hypothetical protein